MNLAAFRVVVALLFITTREVWSAAGWASLPAALAVTPRGWGWTLALFPPNATAARIAHLLVVASATLGLLGCYARPAFTGLTIAALYLLALPLRSGMPFHDQHLVWFAAICAASPCADALALDAWHRRRRGGALARVPARAAAYGVPLRVAWLLIGVIFFFPGLWKLRAAGLAWITSDNLRNQLYWKWTVVPGLTPPLRIDRFPWLLHASAAAVVALELSLAFAIWRRWSRRAVVIGALLFHAGAHLFMGIDFSGLWMTYVVFVDWEALARRWVPLRRRAAAPVLAARLEAPRLWPSLLVGIVLVAGAIEAGLRGATAGWPFACYPTFQDRAGVIAPALAMALVRDTGEEVPFDIAAGAPPGQSTRERIFGLRLIAAAGAPGAPARFAAYWDRLQAWTSLQPRRHDLRAVRFYWAEMSMLPEDRGKAVEPGALIYELSLGRASTRTPRARSGATTSAASDDSASTK